MIDYHRKIVSEGYLETRSVGWPKCAYFSRSTATQVFDFRESRSFHRRRVWVRASRTPILL
jgi:hypothetical protein